MMEALMRTIGVGAVGLLLGIVITLGAQTGNSTEVDRAHDEFMRAARERNPTGWANTVTDDVQLVPNSGELVNKTERMEEIKNGEALISSQLPVSELAKRPEYRLRVYGDAALVTWTSAPQQGGPGPKGNRFVRVFVKQGSSWRLAHQQGTPIQ